MFTAPSAAGLPPLSVLLDSIPAQPRQLARHLGVSLTTLHRWRRADQAPRAAMLALFWESPWGRSLAHTAADNAARAHAAHAQALADQVTRLRGQLAQALRAYGQPRAANDPLLAVDLASVADFDDGDQKHAALYAADDAPVAHAPAPQLGQRAAQGLSLVAWVAQDQGIKVTRDFALNWPIQTRQLALCARVKLQAPAHKPSSCLT
ncbi:MAG TPA: hypothetical protein PLA33_02640 [Ottowia sp.]|nr:hypothetical protein [Ottowia sp.]HNI84319.1 hypothetical protein [Ottowia sp.]HNJ45004.1 hypothetical protein [Ottowia sp.]HNK53231.1 hypothetical protein [Ottowia sp.]HNL41001.1 hypothetical protein [Ottowia sp.]